MYTIIFKLQGACGFEVHHPEFTQKVQLHDGHVRQKQRKVPWCHNMGKEETLLFTKSLNWLEQSMQYMHFLKMNGVADDNQLTQKIKDFYFIILILPWNRAHQFPVVLLLNVGSACLWLHSSPALGGGRGAFHIMIVENVQTFLCIFFFNHCQFS